MKQVKKVSRRGLFVLIGWMMLIFYLSSQVAPASNELSKGFLDQLLKIIGTIFPSIELSQSLSNHLIRKFAHFFAYMILGLISMNVFKKHPKRVLISLLICVVFASSDEFHQLFVPGRGGMLTDVVIDSLGGILGLIIFEVLCIYKGQK